MKTKAQKGSALMIVTIMTVIFCIANISLFLFVENTAKETKIHGEKRIKSYYASVSGMRYAYILLSNPASLGFPGIETYEVQGNEFGGDFFNDIGINPGDLNITIRLITDVGHPDLGKYEITARFRNHH
jgi:hypothetical protein